MILTYAQQSRPSAIRIAEQNDSITLNRGADGDINWGRSIANTLLNRDISNVTNKRVMRELFKQSGVPMPELISIEDVADRLADGMVIIGRPDKHTKGRGFWKITNIREFQRAISRRVSTSGIRLKQPATHFMEYINKERAPREYRVHVFCGKSIRISEKIFTPNGDYTTGKPRHEVKHVRRAAKKALEAVGIDFGAVDILANDTECWVLEVNASPGLGGSMPKLYADTFIKYMEER